MAWSKTTRISVMLGIDTAFFLLELVVGLLVHSLALMADAFHMLNDIISLMVGLWAVMIARKSTTDKYTYGWLRAEILGAFLNAVFLIALCLSILLEALGRLIDPPEINNPKLILIVGSLGLASNLVGFVVLGGHGHDHGHGHEHDEHAHDDASAAEQGRADPHANDRLSTIDDHNFYPPQFHDQIIAQCNSQLQGRSSSGSSTDADTENTAAYDEEPNEETPLVGDGASQKAGKGKDAHGSRSASGPQRRYSALHRHHNHNKPKKASKSHGHSHGDMGMNAMVLHVLGDALGNVGVIVTALIIWLTDWPGRFYADPAVSLFITLIILRSALPLTFATSKVLLQATPDHIDVNDVRRDIQTIPHVLSCHHIHVWQLSDTNVVASMHIQVSFPISEEAGEKYMGVARDVRECLHAYGIHSATIQPEFCLEEGHDHEEAPEQSSGDETSRALNCANAQDDRCLLECVNNCAGQGCCLPPKSDEEDGHSAHSP